ncbi:MAG TPA: flagellar hook-basal body complex protein FliE [Polyangiaceae bacterium]
MIRVESTSDIARVMPSDATIDARQSLGIEKIGSSDTVIGPQPTDTVSFGDVLAKTVTDASAADHAAAQKVDALAAGTSDDIHGTMIATKEAEISMKLVGSMRNKLLDAFQELWRTSV